MSRIVSLIAVSIFVFCTCTSGIDLERERETLLQTDFEFAKTSEEKGAVEAFYAYLDSAAIMFPINAHPVFGKEAIHKRMSNAPNLSLTWEPKQVEVSKSADLGYTWGTYQYETRASDGASVVGYGKYVNVWKKQQDGSWKVVIDIGNQSPPPRDK
ncbi:MAG: DUF4440 domain-containing protein [Aliifodinibius sp.]|nr:DUF4440 domain-containing protein [Fodinibius sp.]